MIRRKSHYINHPLNLLGSIGGYTLPDAFEEVLSASSGLLVPPATQFFKVFEARALLVGSFEDGNSEKTV